MVGGGGGGGRASLGPTTNPPAARPPSGHQPCLKPHRLPPTAMSSRAPVSLFGILIFLLLSLHKEARVGCTNVRRYSYSSAGGWGHKDLPAPVWGHPPKINNNHRIPEVREGQKHRLDQGAARVVQSSHYEQEYVLGRKIIFICTARGNPRPRITWYKDGVELYAHNYFQVHEWEIGLHKLKSKMEIDPATLMDVGYYECQANNKYAVDHRGFRTQYTAGM